MVNVSTKRWSLVTNHRIRKVEFFCGWKEAKSSCDLILWEWKTQTLKRRHSIWEIAIPKTFLHLMLHVYVVKFKFAKKSAIKSNIEKVNLNLGDFINRPKCLLLCSFKGNRCPQTCILVWCWFHHWQRLLFPTKRSPNLSNTDSGYSFHFF